MNLKKFKLISLKVFFFLILVLPFSETIGKDKKNKKEENRQKKLGQGTEETQIEQSPIAGAQDASSDNGI